MKKKLTGITRAGSITLAVFLAAGLAVTAAGTAGHAYAEERVAASDLDRELEKWGDPVSGTFGENYMIDFENEEIDTPINEIESLSDLWIAENATGEHISKVEERKDTQALHFAPFSRMYTAEGISNKYAFSADINMPSDQGFGMFFRSTGEESVNPFFEDDGSGLGIFGIGPAGIYLTPNGKQLKLTVKYYDERKNSDKGGKYINNKQISLKVDCNFNDEFCNITVLDDGAGAQIYVNGTLIATLKFEAVVEGYEELLSFSSYFSLVTVYDAAGKEKATVKNALVCADDSTLAFGMRINEAYVDNVSVTEYAHAVSKVELKSEPRTAYSVGDKFDGTGSELDVTLENGAVRKLQLSESMLEGFDTSEAGEKEVKVVYSGYEGDPITFKITVSEKEAATDAPAATDAAAGTAVPTDDREESKGVKPLTVGLIAGGVLIVLIAVAAAVLAKFKKKKAE